MKKVIFSITSTLAFLAFVYLIAFMLQPSGYVLDNNWTVTNNTTSTAFDFPYVQNLETPSTLIFESSFLKTENNTLIITRPETHAIEVLVNGISIYKIGESEKPTANIWNTVHLIPLPDNLQPENQLTIKLSAPYAAGLRTPPYLAKSENVFFRTVIINWILNDLLNLAIGASLTIGSILILLSLSRHKNISAEIYMGLACILSALYCFDYNFRATTGSVDFYFITKKILIISAYLATLFFSFGLEKYYRNSLKITRFLAIPTIISVIVMILFPDFYNLWIFLPLLNIILLINFVAAITLILTGKRGKDWLIIPAILLSLSILQLIINMAFNIPLPNMIQYIVLVAALSFGTNLILEFNQIFHENVELQRKTNIDPLTGAYNRRVLNQLRSLLHDVLIVIDLDNFKQYNDKYGHAEGDELLVQFVKLIQHNLRQNDLIIRLGGDEFAIILDSAGTEDAEKIIQRIQAQFHTVAKDNQVGFSYGIGRLQESFTDSIKQADQMMYFHKKSKKTAA